MCYMYRECVEKYILLLKIYNVSKVVGNSHGHIYKNDVGI